MPRLFKVASVSIRRTTRIVLFTCMLHTLPVSISHCITLTEENDVYFITSIFATRGIKKDRREAYAGLFALIPR